MTKKTPSHGLDGFYEALRRPGITRISDGRWFAGVAAGIARRLGVDPLVVRAGFILFGLFFGMGIALYLVAWLLMPDEKGKLPIEAALKYGDGGSIFLLVIAGISLFGGGPWWNGDWNGFRFVGFVALAAVAWWFLTQTDSGRDLLKSRPRAGAPDPTRPQDPTAPPATSGVSTGNAAAAAGATLAAPTPPPAPEPAPAWAPSPAAYREPRVRVRGIGFAAGLLILGLATVAGAVVLSVADSIGWSGSHVGLAFAAALGTLGLGLVVAGLAGRRSGWLTPFAVFGIFATLMTMITPRGMTVPFHVGDANYVVTTMSADNRYQNGIGKLRVDLAGADYSKTGGKDVVNVTLGLGQLDLVLPPNASVMVHAKAKAGDLKAVGANEANHVISGSRQFAIDGTGWNETVTYGPAGQPEIEVYAEVGAGQINITTGSAS
ncbi:MAG: PspC domain-containing protein [Intrasporangium sp.]|uniref:PspC domain-containing protein n=1 Tax=Intrasporangium sp. TaxID=1925024 RepID=UPI003F7ED809